MAIEMIVYEKIGAKARIAGMGGGELREVELVDYNKASEGNIYLGKITNKIELANGKIGYFVNIGDSREAFINAEEQGLEELIASVGEDIVVQLAQEQRAEKGARLVRSIQLVGNNLVYCPYRMTVEVSPKIEDKNLAADYRQAVVENTTGQEGWILRTSAVKVPVEEVVLEMEQLRNRFEEVCSAAKKNKAPALLLSKLNPLFDYIHKNRDSLRKMAVNSRTVQEEITAKFGDHLVIEIMPNPFADHGLDEAILDALQRTVKLKSGGRITIEETKACVAIDVDSGDDNGQGSLGRLNMEAAVEIVKQIKLRNLSGKIVIDFAGASEIHYLKNVIEYLENELRRDYVRTTVNGLSRGGLVEINRMRRRPSLRDLLTEECSCCEGTGRVEK